jgi:hypothetical protein
MIPVDAANDEGPSTTDACSPILNASDVAGRIALVDRGTCTFLQKARNVQAAGALGLIVANNVEGTVLIRLTGADPEIHIPVVQITQANGNAIKASLAAFEKVAVSLLADADRRAGADRLNRPMLYNATPAKSGATMSHWDPIASPNQLMEPDIEIDLMHTVEPPHDLTLSALRDLGWFADFDGVPDGVDQCPGSDPRPTLVIQGCDTHVSNAVFSTGCRVSDYFKPCDGKASDSAEFAACVAGVSRQLTEVRSIRPRESQSIQACVAPVQHP